MVTTDIDRQVTCYSTFTTNKLSIRDTFAQIGGSSLIKRQITVRIGSRNAVKTRAQVTGADLSIYEICSI